MIITTILRLVGDVWKQVHIIRYRNGKTIERQHAIGNPIPEEIREIKQPVRAEIVHPEFAQYQYHHQMGL